MRRIISEAYKGWKTAAGLELNCAKLKPFTKPVSISILLGTLRANADISNRVKAIEDLLVAHGIIPGDSIKWVRRIEIEISDEPFEGFEVCISDIASRKARIAA